MHWFFQLPYLLLLFLVYYSDFIPQRLMTSHFLFHIWSVTPAFTIFIQIPALQFCSNLTFSEVMDFTFATTATNRIYTIIGHILFWQKLSSEEVSLKMELLLEYCPDIEKRAQNSQVTEEHQRVYCDYNNQNEDTSLSESV